MNNEKNENKPIKQFKAGNIKATIFENKNSKGSFKTVSITKAYKQGDTIKYTSNFDMNDLPKVFIVVLEIYKFMNLSETENESEN